MKTLKGRSLWDCLGAEAKALFEAKTNAKILASGP